MPDQLCSIYTVNGLSLIDTLASDFDAFGGHSDGSIEKPAFHASCPWKSSPETVTS